MFAQRWKVDVKHIQPEVKILPQLSAADGLLWIFVRGRKYPHVHRRFALASQPADFVVFQHAQKLRLRWRGHLADFVQQQRPAVRQFETADAPLCRPGERAAFVAEDFAFHQCFGNRRAVDGYKRSCGSRRELVNGARDDLLARSCLARDQHRRRTRRRQFHNAHHFLHLFRCPHQIAQSSGFSELPLQHRKLPRVPGLAQRPVQQRAQHRSLHRFFDIPERSGFDRRYRALLTPFAGNDDRRHLVQFRSKLFQQVQPVHAGQLDVRNQRVRLVARELRQRFFRRTHAQNVASPPLQQLFVTLSRVVLIFDDEHAVLLLQRLDRPYRRPCLFPHGSQPLFGSLSMNHFLTILLDSSTLTSPRALAKFSGLL